jgi:hypothetical protein
MGLLRVELLFYRQIEMPSKDFYLLNWWEKHEH